jgi:hypothetical protein
MWNVYDYPTYSSWQDDSLMVKKLIENIPTPLVSFAGSGVCLLAAVDSISKKQACRI